MSHFSTLFFQELNNDEHVLDFYTLLHREYRIKIFSQLDFPG